MKKTFNFILIAMTLILCSCSMPTTTVRTIDDRPTLAIKGAPEDATLFVDGLNMGPAIKYNGDPNVLGVESGTHVVRVTTGQTVIYEQRIFVESSLKTITVR